MSGERYVDPFQDPNDQDALARATDEIDAAAAQLQADGIVGSNGTHEDMIDQKYTQYAIEGDNPPSDQNEDED